MSSGYYIQLVFSLAILAGILFAVLRVSQNIHRKKYTGDIKVVDRQPIDSNASLLIVQVNEKKYLLSSANKEVKVIDTL